MKCAVKLIHFCKGAKKSLLATNAQRREVYQTLVTTIGF